MAKRRVVVTGLGAVSPLGNDVKSNWNAITKGISGVAPIKSFDTSNFTTKFAGQLNDFSYEGIVDKSDARRVDDYIIYSLVAAYEALKDAGIEGKPIDIKHDRIATYVGSGIGGLDTIFNTSLTLRDKGPGRVSPFFVPGSIINMAAGMISIEYGFTGPNLAFTTACTTGTHAIGGGYRAILYGEADVVVTGGSEAPVNQLGLAGFMAARALSTRNDEPTKASRPWDKDRDGFILSEGASILVLEEYEHAKKRNANIYAELIGYGMSADAWHMTSPPERGEGAALAMKNALKDAGINPADIDYINAHGTSTKLGDIAEICAIKDVFGAKPQNLMVSSTKSMTGHLLGAAGSLESVYAVMSAKEGVVPPTINLDNPDEGCDLDLVPHEARSVKLGKILSNSFGFGGTNASLIFSRV